MEELLEIMFNCKSVYEELCEGRGGKLISGMLFLIMRWKRKMTGPDLFETPE